ncbi:hypothetical protein U9M48_028780 [Paspalum notatum var. saurae]|uniref:Uncharacterized protein n=1 Tax=Paspalum notatum var. saurae TaxID=547442 RepID=A0AAQ3X233_PASNO
MPVLFINRAKENGQIQGLVPHLVEDGLSILKDTDDTIFFLEHNLEQVKNLNIILCSFEKFSRLKINFHTCDIFCYEEIFGCSVGCFPFRYLGIPMNHKMLQNKDWKVVEDHLQRKKNSWKGKLLSYGGVILLINSISSSLPMLMISFFYETEF